MGTGFRCWRIKDELRLAALLRDRVVVGDYNRTIGIPISGQAQAKHSEVDTKGQQRRRQDEEDYREEDSPEAVSQSERLGHEAPIISPEIARRRHSEFHCIPKNREQIFASLFI